MKRRIDGINSSLEHEEDTNRLTAEGGNRNPKQQTNTQAQQRPNDGENKENITLKPQDNTEIGSTSNQSMTQVHSPQEEVPASAPNSEEEEVPTSAPNSSAEKMHVSASNSPQGEVPVPASNSSQEEESASAQNSPQEKMSASAPNSDEEEVPASAPNSSAEKMHVSASNSPQGEVPVPASNSSQEEESASAQNSPQEKMSASALNSPQEEVLVADHRLPVNESHWSREGEGRSNDPISGTRQISVYESSQNVLTTSSNGHESQILGDQREGVPPEEHTDGHHTCFRCQAPLNTNDLLEMRVHMGCPLSIAQQSGTQNPYSQDNVTGCLSTFDHGTEDESHAATNGDDDCLQNYIQSLQTHLEILQRRSLIMCIDCRLHYRNVAFKPCGHFILCMACSNNVLRCPTCGTMIMEKIPAKL